MKNNSKKHLLINKSLIVFLSLNMLACSTIKDNVDNVKNDNQQVEYNHESISVMIDNAINNVVWSDKKILYPNLNITSQYADNVEKYHIGSRNFEKAYSVNMVQNPSRLVLDLTGEPSMRNKYIPVKSEYVSAIRVGAHPNKTRLVFDLNPSHNASYNVLTDLNGLNLVISDDKNKINNMSDSSVNSGRAVDKKEVVAISKAEKDLALEIDNEKLSALATNELQLKYNDADLNNKVKYSVSKIQCTEVANKLEVKVNVNNKVDYSLNKISDSEYTLRLKNTNLTNQANKPIALPKTYSSLNSILVSKDNVDTVIKFFVNSDTELSANVTKSGLVISEKTNKLLNNLEEIVVADKDVILDKIHSEKALIQKEDASKKDIVEDNVVTPQNVHAQMDLTKINDNKENVKNEESQKELGGTIETEDLVEEDKKGLGNEGENEKEDFEKLDEEIVKLLDPASGYTGKLISLDFQDTEIDNALKIIAEVSNLNIVTSDDITGKVSLRLNNVPWDQALDVILKTNGLDKVQEGNVLRIAPVNRLKSEREELKAARQAEENLEPLQLAYRKISYAKAAELQALVETVLSDRGSVTFDDRSNQIFIKDTKPRIKDAFEMIKKADLRTPQILLETQIIEAQRNLVRELGSEFGFTVVQSNETGNGTGYNFPSNVTVSGSNSETGNTFSSFPAASGSAVSFIFDSLDGSKSLQARISGMEEEGKLKVISKPSVVTTNNTPAEIKSVETVLVRLPEGGTSIATGQGSSASGSSKAATESIDAGITLKVTPQASPDYYVLLDIMGESSHFGSRSVDGIPSLVIRRATSTVLVSSGQTFALGGIYKVTDKDNVTGVPFMKDIPVLGHLFRRAGIDNSDEELLFFVTPRIVEGSFDDAK